MYVLYIWIKLFYKSAISEIMLFVILITENLSFKENI